MIHPILIILNDQIVDHLLHYPQLQQLNAKLHKVLKVPILLLYYKQMIDIFDHSVISERL